MLHQKISTYILIKSISFYHVELEVCLDSPSTISILFFGNQQVPISLIALNGRISDPSLSYLKGCCSIDKLFRADFFLDWKWSQHWIFPQALSHSLLELRTTG